MRKPGGWPGLLVSLFLFYQGCQGAGWRDDAVEGNRDSVPDERHRCSVLDAAVCRVVRRHADIKYIAAMGAAELV
jgi:hypothetical protein